MRPHVEYRIINKSWGTVSATVTFFHKSFYELEHQSTTGRIDCNDLMASVKARIAFKNFYFFDSGFDHTSKEWKVFIAVDGDYAPK